MHAVQEVIGILGGMGPYAGLDLFKKLHQSTQAQTDQEHLPILLFSLPDRIVDRSTYLFDHSKPDPNPALIEIAESMEQAGVTKVGLPCNTAHAPAIFDVITQTLKSKGSSMEWVHMIDETALEVKKEGHATVGVLSSLAVFHLDIYKNVLEANGIRVVRPNEQQQKELINPVIFDEEFGIKAHSEPVTAQARKHLIAGIEMLKEQGADAIVLGCTEFPLAVPENEVLDLPMIDPSMILARSLIRATYPDRLRTISASR